MALFWATNWRDSVSLLSFPFLATNPSSHLRCHLLLSLLYHFLRVFHITINWWSFAGVWATASLIKSPGHFSVFWPTLTMLSFRWSPLIRWLPTLSSPTYEAFVDCSKCTNYNCYHNHLHVRLLFFSFLLRSKYLSLLSPPLWLAGTIKPTIWLVTSFFVNYHLV